MDNGVLNRDRLKGRIDGKTTGWCYGRCNPRLVYGVWDEVFVVNHRTSWSTPFELVWVESPLLGSEIFSVQWTDYSMTTIYDTS